MNEAKKLWKTAVLCAMCLLLLCSCSEQTKDAPAQTGWVVTFNLNDREQPVVQVIADETGHVQQPEDPVREDYTFTGWYENKRCAGEPFDFTQELHEDVFLYAGWATTKIRITLDFGIADEAAQTLNIECGTLLDETALPEVPAPENSIFAGWCLDAACMMPVDFSQPFTKNTTLYACWQRTKITVHFDLGYYGAEAIQDQIIDLTKDETVQEPEMPVRGDEGDYRFDGWYVGSGKNRQLYDFTSVPEEDMTLCAAWTQLRATVTYDLGDGTTETEKVRIGKNARKYDRIQREGYTFNGWYYDQKLTSAADMAQLEITGDLTVYASWTALPRTITYDYNYDGAPESVTVEAAYGMIMTEPEEPTREGMVFTGWYTDKRCRKPFTFGGMLTEDVKLYAGWGEKGAESQSSSCVLTFYSNDGTDDIYRTEEVARNKFSAMRTDGVTYPVREGYQAFGWYTTPDCQSGTEFDPNSRIKENMDLYVCWKKAYVFEAELTQLTDIPIGDTGKYEDKLGFGESSNPKGLYLIEWDCYNAGASNDYYVSYLYNPGSYLEFCITASENVTNATLVLRLTPELHDMYFLTGGEDGTAAEKDGYKVYVNPVYSFNSIVNKEQLESYEQMFTLNADLTGAVTKDQDPNYSTKRAFEDYTITSSLNLHEGSNIIRLVTDNNHDYGGSMHAAAPMVDCIKIYADAELTWTEGCEYTSNLDGIDARWPAKQAEE